MDALYQVHGVQGVGLARAGCTAALIHAAHGTALAQQHGNAGEGFSVLSVTDAQTGDGGDGKGMFQGRSAVEGITSGH